jgi:hypothetical protein
LNSSTSSSDNRFPAFLRRWLLVSLGAIGATAAVSMLVDPLGMSPLKVQIPGLNELKPLKATRDRQVKPFELVYMRPDRVIVGSSRTKQSMDPALFPGRTYNGAMDNLGDPKEIAYWVDFIVENVPSVKRIDIEVIPTAILGNIDVELDNKFDWSIMLSNFVSSALSIDALSYSLNTVKANLRGKADRMGSAGFYPLAAPPSNFSVANAVNFAISTGSVRSRGSWKQAISRFSSVMDNCGRHQVDCRFFISPLHADVLYGLSYSGTWDDFINMKKMLAEIGPTYDFAYFSPEAEERVNPPVYWWEAFHYSPALGAKIAEGLMDRGDFGRRLTPENASAELARQTAELAAWEKTHPMARSRYDAALRTFSTPPKSIAYGAATSTLTVDDIAYDVQPVECGAADFVGESTADIFVTGWAEVPGNGRAADGVVLLNGSNFAFSAPNLPRPELDRDIASPIHYSGFFASLTKSEFPVGSKIRLFALDDSKRAACMLPIAAPNPALVTASVHKS